MFKFHKTLDVLTLFHSPRSEASNRVLSVLKTANTAAEQASINNGAENSAANGDKKQLFELDVIEGPMTTTQLRSILDYVGDGQVSEVVDGARGVHDAMKILEGAKGIDAVRRPIVVDWNNGRVVLGEKQSALKQLLNSLPK